VYDTTPINSSLRAFLPSAMAELSTVAAAAALQVSLLSTNVTLDYFESNDVGFTSGSQDLGRMDASVSVAAHDLVARPLRKRVQAGAEARFRITPRVHQESASCAAASIEGIARVVRAEFVLIVDGHARTLAFSVVLAASGETQVGSVDLVVAVPHDTALGSEVALHRVMVACCDVPLGEAPVSIVGFNHEPAPAGRVYAAARAGDIPALTQALDDGCSTQEEDAVGAVCSA
jgi:hypothetical protein